MTLRSRRSVAAAATTLVLLAGSAQATTITINDTSASDLVTLSWTGGLAGGLTSIGVMGSRCSEVGLGPVSLDAGTVICSEGSPLVFTVFANANFGEGNHIVHANFWEDRVGGVLSDTASIVGTQLTSTTVEDVLTFISDVEGGPALTSLIGGTGIDLVNFIESGLPQGVILGHCDCPTDLHVTVASDAVPEPASLLLLASGLVGVCRWRQRPLHAPSSEVSLLSGCN